MSSSAKASHILVKHAGSRRPASRLSDKITRSEEEARSILEGIRAQVIRDPKQFEEIAKAKSDCGSGERGGDLGFFKRGEMQKPFEDATFALQVGELSEIIKTDSGLHIIKRTG